MEKVRTIAHLKQILGDGESHDFVILLTGGLRSRKLLSWDGTSVFYVFNLSDDTEQELTEEQLMNRDYTNVGYAIGQGALYLDEYVLKVGDKVLWADFGRLSGEERVFKVYEVREDMVKIASGEPTDAGYSEAEVPICEVIKVEE